jgi:heavy metal efflux system protein
VLAIYQQDVALAIATKQLEKTKLKPDMNLGINNTSFRGIAPNNVTYNGFDRFTSVQLGLSIPVFTKSQKQKINAMQVQQQITESNIDLVKEKLKNEFQKALLQYQSNVKLLNTFNTTILKNATVIKQTAMKQFINGDINYLDYVALINQAISIENQYIDAKQAVTNSIIQLNFISIQQ